MRELSIIRDTANQRQFEKELVERATNLLETERIFLRSTDVSRFLRFGVVSSLGDETTLTTVSGEVPQSSLARVVFAEKKNSPTNTLHCLLG
jgi:hypothetical protein